jgi:hypothetical protein
VKKLITSALAFLLFWLLFSPAYFSNAFAAVGNTCNIERDGSGNLISVSGRCTVCSWDLAEGKCKPTNAGPGSNWSSLRACSDGGTQYVNDESVCSGITNNDDCNLSTVGQCLVNPDVDQDNIGYKWNPSIPREDRPGSLGDCVQCDKSADPDCKYNNRNACLDKETGSSRYKCVAGQGCVECDETEDASDQCKVKNRCEEECADKKLENDPLAQPCKNASGKEGCKEIRTAVGIIPTKANDFTRWILGFALSIAGGIVVLVIIIAGYKLMTSQGDPEKVKNAREQLSAAIVGLLFIIFSLVILEFITRDVLGLPGFGG